MQEFRRVRVTIAGVSENFYFLALSFELAFELLTPSVHLLSAKLSPFKQRLHFLGHPVLYLIEIVSSGTKTTPKKS